MMHAPKELRKVLANPAVASFHGRGNRRDELDQTIERFLSATMDEVRSTSARKAAFLLGSIVGYADFAALFHDAVLRRELTGRIDYSKQRDHAAHTVNNYLLGWYAYLRNTRVRQSLNKAVRERGVGRDDRFPFATASDYFGCVWLYVSLLHDVGYAFEGTVESMSLSSVSAGSLIGADLAHKYFNRVIWRDYEISAAQRKSLFDQVGWVDGLPSFCGTNLFEIADSLRELGNLDLLRRHVGANIFADLADKAPTNGLLAPGACDAFDVWCAHYGCFERKMVPRIRWLADVFENCVDHGLAGEDFALLDHGVAGGLLQLLASTYYYRLQAAIRSRTPLSGVAAKIGEYEWDPVFWWTGIVWATAAVAMHNVSQMKKNAVRNVAWKKPLAIDEDPLAYLGILVDVLQCWDRYAVRKTIESDPVQGVDVEIGTSHGKLQVKFCGPKAKARAKETCASLQQSLAGWRDIVEINS